MLAGRPVDASGRVGAQVDDLTFVDIADRIGLTVTRRSLLIEAVRPVRGQLARGCATLIGGIRRLVLDLAFLVDAGLVVDDLAQLVGHANGRSGRQRSGGAERHDNGDHERESARAHRRRNAGAANGK